MFILLSQELRIFSFLFLTFSLVLVLRCFKRIFSSCGKRGPLFTEVCGLLVEVVSLVVEHGL